MCIKSTINPIHLMIFFIVLCRYRLNTNKYVIKSKKSIKKCIISTSNLIHIVQPPPPPGLIKFFEIEIFTLRTFLLNMGGPPAHRLSTFKESSPLIHKMWINCRFLKTLPLGLIVISEKKHLKI